MYDSVMIGTVAVGQPEWGYVKSLVALAAPGSKTFNLVRGKQGIDAGHNQLNQEFLDSGCDWLLSMDSDAVLHPLTLERLLSWGKPCVCALAVGRIAPFLPVVYNSEDRENATSLRETEVVRGWIKRYPRLMSLSAPVVLQPRPDDALFEVDRMGAHCLLTHRSVIEAIEPPWFTRWGKNAERGSGSDFWFAKKVVEAGFQPYVDLSVTAGHIVHGHVASALDFMVWDQVINYETGNIEVPVGE